MVDISVVDQETNAIGILPYLKNLTVEILCLRVAMQIQFAIALLRDMSEEVISSGPNYVMLVNKQDRYTCDARVMQNAPFHIIII